MNTREWEIRELRSNSTGTYYSLTARTVGQIDAPVTVKHSTRHDTMICLTCLTNDKCAHSRFVRDYVTQHPTMEKQSA